VAVQYRPVREQDAEPLGLVQHVRRDLEALGEEREVADQDPVEARRLVLPREAAGERRVDERPVAALGL
jgi:hypothetical protein